MPAPAGTGVIAGGPVRAVVETVGIADIRAKAIRSNNPLQCSKSNNERTLLSFALLMK